MAHTKEGITESARKLIVVPIKRNIKRGYLDIFKHPLGTKDPRVKKVKKEVNMADKKEVAEDSKGKSKVPGFMKEMAKVAVPLSDPPSLKVPKRKGELKRGGKLYPTRGKAPGFMQEIAEERKGEPARKTKEARAKDLARKMERGYRKGYRVPKRPKRGNGRKAPRSPFRKSSGR